MMNAWKPSCTLLLAAVLGACAADQPPDPATLVKPQELITQLVGNTLKGSNSQISAITFYETAERTRFRTTILSNGRIFNDRSTLSIQGDAICSTSDTVFERRTFCSKFYRTPTGFRSAPTDNRPAGTWQLLPGNPEGL